MGLLPQPVRIEQVPDRCILELPLSIGANNAESLKIGKALVDILRTRLNLPSSVGLLDDGAEHNIVLEVLDHHDDLEPLRNSQEGYTLAASERGVRIQALAASGLFYGVQSLYQLFPTITSDDAVFNLPRLKVVDAPRYHWRGVLLDVGRHYYSVDFIKKLLDLMALHKMNRFHWHLTEDQGWRIEIKAYPRLTEFGAWRGASPHKYGGCYTQEQVKEIVAYAADRFIEVVPEIEMPGHSGAAIAAYPFLSCTGQPTEVPNQWGIHEDVLCAGKEAVFEFLEGVLKEVVTLFPFNYLHIGGDECPKSRWAACPLCQQRMQQEGLATELELQSYFIRRASHMAAHMNRRIIGWDEILEGGLADGATVMSWRGMAGGIIAAKAGHDVIMTPTSHCYFDYRQAPSPEEPGAWYACLPLQAVYHFDPNPCPPRTVPTPLPFRAIPLPPPEDPIPPPPAAPAPVPAPCGPLPPPATTAETTPTTSTSTPPSDSQPQPNTPTTFPDTTAEPAALPAPAAAKSAAVAAVAAACPPTPAPPASAPAPEGGSLPAEADSMDAEESAGVVEGGAAGGAAAAGPGSADWEMRAVPEEGVAGGPAGGDVEVAGDVGSLEEDEYMMECCPPPQPGPPSSPTKVQDRTLTEEEEGRILGGQANLWTEYIGDEATAEYMLLPRLCAISEALWSPIESRDWTNFRERLQSHVRIFDALGYHYRALQ